MLINEIFVLFSMMWLYPVLFSINSRLQKCNLFACTPRMNNSRLSKHTICTSANFKFNSGLNREPVQVNKNLLDG